ncbi:MAG: type I-C CRISPR-associated protein Cas5c [Eubacteriales bacterium]|nr:type I-C CRISPR-associated protein Cas5c [Eubacteriales bacterium]
MDNIITYKVYGRYALFTDPVTKLGGEKCSYQVPTYQALKGITESIYWKPTITWYIDKVRVMKPIRTQSQAVKPVNYSEGGHLLSLYSYLYDVEYRVQAHFEWNEQRPDLAGDYNENKHYFIAKRMLERGGRRDIFLGTRECQGYVEPCDFDGGAGAYDDGDPMSFGLMVHGLSYPSETGKDELSARLWPAVMKKGVIEFPRPEECSTTQFVREMTSPPLRTSGAGEEGLLDGYEGR